MELFLPDLILVIALGLLIQNLVRFLAANPLMTTCAILSMMFSRKRIPVQSIQFIVVGILLLKLSYFISNPSVPKMAVWPFFKAGEVALWHV